jgi:aminoglycoside phosphotransferase (APT) family kinase protein
MRDQTRSGEPADGRAGITAELVARLVADQHPRWAGLPVVPVEADGWDNRTYRLGDTLTVRLPTHERYVAAVAKEDRWLPVLAPQLPLAVPEPVATGRPGAGYPHPWSVRRWIPGRPVGSAPVEDLTAFARTLAGFLRALRRADPTGGPAAGAHSFFRGCPPEHYDDEVVRSLESLGPAVDRPGARTVWRDALASHWTGTPVWFHGDIAPGNLLLDDRGRLTAVLDFGTSGVGDPACELVIAWTFLHGEARSAFRAEVGLDDDAWRRARGWALWKALLVAAEHGPTSPVGREQLRVVDEVLTDHARES